jgi:gliding motility-associated lipoprotein GldH
MQAHRTSTFFRSQVPEAFWLLAIFVFTLSACQQNTVFDNNKSFDDNVWKADDVIRLDVNINDTSSAHKFYLNVRHKTSYRYANLFLFISTTFPDGAEGRDTVECILAEPSGKWLGKGISNIRDCQVLLRRGLRFPQKGNYVFEFEQAMREKELDGIMDIGLRIVKE